METKKCPFCSEVIKIEAIKCKHCGEFLNDFDKINSTLETSTSKDVIGVVPSNLLSQNFNIPIILCYIGLALTFIAIKVSFKNPDYSESTASNVIDFIGSLLLIGILIALNNYLFNFKVDKVRKKIKGLIIIEFISILFFAFLLVFPENEELQFLIFFIGLIVIILSITFNIIVGTQLAKFKNEYFKQVRNLGYSLIIITIATIFCELSKIVFSEDDLISNFSQIISEILGFVQLLFFIYVFKNAKRKMKEERDTIKESA